MSEVEVEVEVDRIVMLSTGMHLRTARLLDRHRLRMVDRRSLRPVGREGSRCRAAVDLHRSQGLEGRHSSLMPVRMPLLMAVDIIILRRMVGIVRPRVRLVDGSVDLRCGQTMIWVDVTL